MTYDAIVVGLGAHGAATLHQLAQRGVRALGIDRWSPPHAMGSSHGETRVTRQGVGEGADYAPLAIRSHAIWRELEALTGQTLLVECGMLFITSSSGGQFHGVSGFVDASAAVAARHGVPHEVLSAEEVLHRFPQFGLKGGERAYYEPGGGFVHPERCIAAQLAQAERLGARILRDTRVTEVVEDGSHVRVTAGGETYAAAQAVVTAGAWTPELAGAGMAGLHLRPQTLHWYACDDPAAYDPDRTPVFGWMHGDTAEESFYGFPIPRDVETRAVKVAMEGVGTIAAIDDLDRTPPAGAGEALFDTQLQGRLRGLHRQPVKSRVCVYASALDAQFRVVRSSEAGRVLGVSACSGHGFKHSAALGECLATMLSEGGAVDWRTAAAAGDHLPWSGR